MKVLQIINSLATGGAERLITESIPLYQEKGIQMELLCLNNKLTPFWENLEKKSNTKIIGLTSGSVYNPLLIFKIIPYLKKYDLVHAHLFPTLYWVVLAKWISFSKTKIVYTEHSTNNRRRDKKLFKFLDKFIYSRLVYIGCISEATKANLIQYLDYKKSNISVIFNGINLKYFDIKRINNYLDFNHSDFKLIQISSFTNQKDQPTLIKSMTLLPDNFKLILVGDGPLRKDNEDLVNAFNLENRVFFLGIRNDIVNLVKFSDVCILSSNYEGFGLAILEGMACGKPSIASNIDGVKEIIANYGLLFQQGNSKELAELILKLHDDHAFYNQIAKQCLERAKHFDIHKMVNSYINVYKNILNHAQ